MKKFYKALAITAMAVMTFSMAGCGSSGSSSGAKTEAEQVKGEVYETSVMSVLVPDGWMVFPKADIFEEYPDEPGNPNGMQIYKGAEDEIDAFTKPGLTIDYYNSDTTMVSPKSYYSDAEDITPFTTGDYTWEGFTATSLDKPLTVLISNDPQIQVSVWTDNDDGTISVDDADVQAILSSITIK